MSTQGKRFKEYRLYLGYKQVQFADYLGVTQEYLVRIESSEKPIPPNVILKLIDKIITNTSRLNFDWLLTGKGKMIKEDYEDEVSLIGDAMGKPNVVVVPFAVNAGAGIASQLVETVSVAYLPFVRPGAYAFNVKGNSMTPIFENSDWVVCYALDNDAAMKAGTPYVLKLQSGEYVLKYVDKRGAKWILRSENYREHQNVEVERDQVERIFEVNLRLTSFWGWS